MSFSSVLESVLRTIRFNFPVLEFCLHIYHISVLFSEGTLWYVAGASTPFHFFLFFVCLFDLSIETTVCKLCVCVFYCDRKNVNPFRIVFVFVL